MKDVIVIGAGASGMIAAVKAAERGKTVLLIEKEQSPGKKILASGNGRCNLMNSRSSRYYGDFDFSQQVLNHCTIHNLITFFLHYGLFLTEESDGRIYPCTYQASAVVSLFKTALSMNRVNLLTGTSVSAVRKNGHLYMVDSSDHHTYTSSSLIVSCGGAAQPKLGGSYDGYTIMRSLGHSIVPVFPSLVPLQTERKGISGLSGLRCKCTVSIWDENTLLHRTSGELLFTDYGVSGICVMQCARFSHNKKTHLYVDFFSSVIADPSEMKNELIRRRKLFASLSPVLLLEGILSPRLAYAVLKQAGIPMRGENAQNLSDSDLDHIVQTGYNYRLDVCGTRGMEFAQVTAGGISCHEFDPSSMQSLLLPGLYATGELLNVDGDCGGYNLMFALASGYLAGISA